MQVNKNVYPDVKAVNDIVLTNAISAYQDNLVDKSIFYSSSTGRLATLSEGYVTGSRFPKTYVALENAVRDFQTIVLIYTPSLLAEKNGRYSVISANSFNPYVVDYSGVNFVNGFKYYSVIAVPYICYAGKNEGSNKTYFTTVDDYFNNKQENNGIMGVTVKLFFGTNKSRSNGFLSFVNVADYSMPTIVKSDDGTYSISETTHIQDLFPHYIPSNSPYASVMLGTFQYPFFNNSSEIIGTKKGYPFLNYNNDVVDKENTIVLFGSDFANQYPTIKLTKNDILEMTATLGFLFTTDINIAQSLDLTNDDNISNDNLYFPVKDNSGLWQGDYTHGEGNKETEQYKNHWNDDVNAPFTNGSPPTDVIDKNKYSDKMERGTGRQASTFNNLYVCTRDDLKALAKLLNVVDSAEQPAEIYQNMKFMGNNPMNAITSINWFPFHILRGGTNNVIIGSTTTNIVANDLYSTAVDIDMGFCSIVPIHKNHKYLNYEPYSAYFLYVPFCNWIKLDAKKIVGSEIHLYMSIDYLSGVVQCEIWVDGIMDSTVSGVASNPVAIQAIDQTGYQNNRFSALEKSAGAVLNMISSPANMMTSAMPFATGLSEFLLATPEYNTAKAITAMLSTYLPPYPCIARYSVAETEPVGYKNSVGYACEFSDVLNNLSGYTVIHNFDTSAITATEEEKREIKAITESGFYI